MGPALQPYLTVLDHWCVDLLGTRATIDLDAGFALSRVTPDFGAKAPLGDRNISRSPMYFVDAGPLGVALDLRKTTTRVRINGTEMTGLCTIEWVDVRRGVVLELGPHVMLLLHARTGD